MGNLYSCFVSLFTFSVHSDTSNLLVIHSSRFKMAPRKLKILTVNEKLKLIREVEKGERSWAVIASEFGIPRSSL